MEMFGQILLLVLGFVMLIKGADWFVDGAAGIALKFGIPQLVIGLTIVAMGTSAPEAAVSITSALKGNAGITIGNVIGSNILNILIILGLTGIIIPVAVAKSTLWVEIPYMLFITAVLWIMGRTGGSINLWEGIMLWALFMVYLIYLLYMAKTGKQKGEKEKEEKPIWMMIAAAIVGIVLIVLGSSFTVDGASYIARCLGVSERVIGLTIVAFGTSLPELVTSVTAAMKGKSDIAIGNIVGSNIFNILFVVGTTALITPVVFETKFLVDTIVAIFAGVLLWISVCRKRELKRGWGIIMLIGYAGYFIYLIK